MMASIQAIDLYRFFHNGDAETLALRGVSLMVAPGEMVALLGAIAKTLLSILAGVFDPPPEALVVPWLYLGATALIALACATLTIVVMRRLAALPDLEALRTR